MLAAICRSESSVPTKASAEPCNAAGLLPGFPDRPPMQGLLARLVGRYARDAVRSAGFAKASEGRHPRRIAGDEPMSPGILWGCRACGAQRRVPGNSPAALEWACGRWGSKGRRLRPPLRWGHGRPPDNVQGRALPGRLVGWRFWDVRDLTRSRGFAAADPGGRLHLPASVVEVHVAVRRLRRIVPLGIRPNGTIPLTGRDRLRTRPDPPGRRLAFLLCAKR